MQKGDPCDALNSSSGVASVSTTDFTTTDSRSTTAKHNVFVTDQFGRQSAAAMATPNRTVASGQPSVGQGVSGLTAGQSPVQRPAVSGSGTVHHLGHGGSTLRTGATPFANLQQGILAMSMQAGQKSVAVGAGAATRITTETKTMVAQTSKTVTTSTVASKLQQSPGPSPRKKIKVEEVPAASEEISANRKLILDEKLKNMRDLKENYIDHLTEFFFLQNGGNLMDYHMWKKRPTPQLVQFLKSGNLDSDDEDEFLQEKKINEEVKVLTSSGSNVPLATPVAISTTLPPSVVALSQQAAPGRNTSMTSTTVSMATSLTSPIHKSASDTKLLTMGSARFSTPTSMSIKKSPPASPGRPRQNSSSFDGTTIKGITTQEAIVERAKQEAQVMHRVSELRKTGLWSARRLPKVQEPPRNKAHWDYLLEEMQWLAADFLQERKWKKAGARKLAKMVHKYFQDLEQKELRAEKEEGLKLKKIGSQMAKIVKEFWSNIEKVVQYKQQSRMDEKRQKALDLHLNFIVDQTEKYSTWLTEGLGQSSRSGSTVGSLNTTPSHSVAGDDEFEPQGGDTDDEETIDKDEEGIDESETRDEIEALQKESEVPLDELLESLPKEILEKPASVSSDIEEDADKSGEDVEFDGEADIDMDVEDSIAEQEKHEKKKDVDKELTELKDEGDMTIDELRDKYAAAYDSDFDMPEDSEGETDTDNEEDESVSDEEEDDDEEEVSIEGEEEPEVGLEYLMNPGDKDEEQQEQVQQQQQPETKKVDEKDPRMQITDIAAEALSLQPKGYTLQTTEVKTPVPFLIKHSLREYQHVGLDWLATMYEKKLNGILADEMGLGKTIQTIALLAHLACEKGVWGPHLIVVPTSVMLNWEMELKKWCPAFKILTYYGSQKERKQKRTGWTKTNAFHICITSYKLVIQDHQSFRRKKWKYFILDEAQNIKNFKSQRWQTLLNFSSQRRLLLTGTPLQNSLMELWSLMHFLMPHVFQSHREFKEWFANPLTGMIEGSREYNESLIRRLHKVLRPFLLRRLKDDVEKQMPKKYEHVVMCHLSKRQRFLYDEFMSQSKTKETLASGHFMSVINILMQLRKVCNHPSLFDPRPIVSPFKMEGLVYNTASETVKAVQYDPFENIDLKSLYPSLADMERDLPAFIAHRVKKLQTPQKLIEEIDDWPPEVPRPKPGKLKTSAIRCVSPGVQSGRSSPLVQVRSGSPVTGLKVHSSTAAVSTSTLSTTSKPAAMSQTRTGVVSPSGSKAVTTQPPLQAKVVPQTALGTNVAASSVVSVQQTTASSQPITVQIQHTDQGTRLMIPPGYIQIVQTSSGQHLIASSAPTASTSSLVVNGPPVANTAISSNTKTVVSSAVSQVKMSPAIQLPSSTGVIGAQKPVMRVSPLGSAESLKSTAVGNTTSVGLPSINTSKASVQTVTSIKDQRTASQISYLKARKEQKASLRKSEFFIEPLYERQQKQREEKLQFISRTNKMHCEVKPVYGEDLCDVVNIYRDAYNSKCSHKNSHSWNGTGWVHCSCVATCEKQRTNPNFYWNQTKGLSDIVHTPEQYLTELSDVLDRFVFVTPPVKAEPLQMHVSHPPPSQLMEDKWREYMLHRHVSPKAVNYHKISTKMTVQFPELRLIQYDCGKLQTMDILLRKLKSGDHRVLIFTQMTRMLDILEAFLNYHGHRYLRLDGTTRVEQRQLLMDRFNADKRIFCFILSTRSGGVGVNLTGADTVIFYDSDWNPTMDAQAQDRCHRIGQTRDVHIYRLISERTVEENILKKANQKRMLGDMAIEGGNFTTAFFKQQTLSELFSEPSGLGTLVKEKEDEEKRKREEKEQAAAAQKASSQKAEPSEQAVMAQFEKALMNTEDETDAIAAERALAEQKADLAEFDENIPWDEKEAEQRKEEEESRVEQELAMLEKELTPVERYAVTFMENMMEPLNAEELLIAEEDIESAKKDWELNRLKALKEEEERRLDLEEDEMLYTYSRDDAYQQVKKHNKLLAAEGRRAAAAEKAQNLKPQRKSNRKSIGSGGVDSQGDDDTNTSNSPNTTPKLTGRNKGVKTPKVTPKSTKAEKVKSNKPEKAAKLKSSAKKSKAASKAELSESKDTNEDVDVETVATLKDIEDITEARKQIRKNLIAKVAKNRKVIVKKGKMIGAHVDQTISSADPSSVVSTEATSLTSLPGYPTYTVDTAKHTVESSWSSYEKSKAAAAAVNARANIFDQFDGSLSEAVDQQKSAKERNLFEQFNPSVNANQNRIPANQTAIPATNNNNVRLVTNQQGRPMVVVSSAGGLQSAQNVVLVQGFPSNLILGTPMAMSLQGTPVNMANLGRGAAPVNLTGARLSGPTSQLLGQRLAARIVSQVPNQANPTFVQRLVSVPNIPGQSASTNVHINPSVANFPRVQTSLAATNVPQQVSQYRLQGGQILANVNMPAAAVNNLQFSQGHIPTIINQTTGLAPQRAQTNTVASIIAAGNMGGAVVHSPTKVQVPSPVTLSGNAVANILASLQSQNVSGQGNIGLLQMTNTNDGKGQNILTNVPRPLQQVIQTSQAPVVRPANKPSNIAVGSMQNQTVVNIVSSASVLSQSSVQVAGSGAGNSRQLKSAVTGILANQNTSTSQNPTIVKVVAGSNIMTARTHSPLLNKPAGQGKIITIGHNQASTALSTDTQQQQLILNHSNLKSAPQSQHSNSPPIQQNPAQTRMVTGIKGLPPGISIPVSLVNSIASGSSISMANMNVLRGLLPSGVPKGSVVRLSTSPVNTTTNTIVRVNSPAINTTSTPRNMTNSQDVNVHKAASQRPILKSPPSNSPNVVQAWSNPNLVIRTRRAALNQKQASPLAQPAVAMPTVVGSPQFPAKLSSVPMNSAQLPQMVQEINNADLLKPGHKVAVPLSTESVVVHQEQQPNGVAPNPEIPHLT